MGISRYRDALGALDICTRSTRMVMKAYVIDSNMLQSDELRRYLKQESGNMAILPDFAWSNSTSSNPWKG